MNRIKHQISPRVPLVNKKQNNTKLSPKRILHPKYWPQFITDSKLHCIYVHSELGISTSDLRKSSYFRSLSSISKFLSY